LSPREDIEEQLVETLIQSPDFVPYVKDQLHYQDFTQPDLARVVQMLWEASAPETSIDIQDLINCCNDEKTKGIISNAILRKPPPPNSKAKVDGCLQKFRQFLVLDMERMIRSNALTQGDDNIDTLEQLIALSNQRRQFVP
jgi:hypothetical protein